MKGGIQDGIEIEIVETWRLIVEVGTVTESMMVKERVEEDGERGVKQSGSNHSTGEMQLLATLLIIMIMKSVVFLMFALYIIKKTS